MSIHYKSRVIHDTVDECFIVEVKRYWLAGWRIYDTFWVCHHMSEEEAKEKAVKTADSLVTRTVIHNGKRV